VTELDRAAERTIIETIRAARPDDAVLGEEGGASDGQTDVRWIVDPLDGTVNYTYGLTEWSVSICAERLGESVAGIVLAPTRDELFAAIRGRGARLNGQPVRVVEDVPLDRALVATGFGYEAAVRARQSALLPRVLPQVRDIRRMGSAALDLCALACGRVDAYYESDLQPWDLAAGALIAREAGARVGSIGGPGRSETFVIGAAPDLYPALEALLRPLLPDEGRGATGTMGR
jgi:myo-inositol-1(or 4)-monophosphatase